MISAKVIAHSVTAQGKEIVTFELVYPRFIHSELMTHRMFSRNAASSRAIPVQTMIDMVWNDPATPIHWGKNQPGMQASTELTGMDLDDAQRTWKDAAQMAAMYADRLMAVNTHKQVSNRILEPFQWMKTVVTATEWDNFFWLRLHPDAQPEIRGLASVMWSTLQKSSPAQLEPGDWHVPYFGDGFWLQGCGIPLEDALAISSSCCAQVSYRKLDDSLDKAKMIYARLVESEPVHASPFEHQATPMKFEDSFDQTFSYFGKSNDQLTQEDVEWEDGITHVDRAGKFWSGNLCGWVQHRQLIPNNVCNEYKGQEA